ncbi:MAG: fatty acid desaturase [Gammaproteobacteria bacterium]|nr:fatty acid desaturase [Gammaproteobacteria bacterium]MDH5651958.1 fatty acid desaturase [Gammaproteobacteria bacterium]
MQTNSRPIPERLNIAILFAALVVSWLLLWTASHFSVGWGLLAGLLFAHVHNTIFSLLHEAVHGIFSPNPGRNDLFGMICAAAFPTSFRMQRAAHLGHHRRNRTDEDLYDYYLPHQSKALRNFQLYAGNLLGLYWFCIPLSNLIYILTPWLYTSRTFIEGPARRLGFEPYVREISSQGIWRIWLECVSALTYQVMIWLLLDLSWQGWLLCHGLFALHWSALQYVDHAWSERDVKNGAWNLRVSAPARLLALNYHLHRAHHQQPDVPWLYLPQLVQADEQRPGYWQIYFRLWRKGVTPAPPMGSKAAL